MVRFVGRLTPFGHLGTRPRPAMVDGIEVVCAGYIANTDELVAEQRRRRVGAPPPTPAHLLALAFQWWGPDLTARVVGEYAAAIYDPTGNALTLVHDEIGLRTLYYCATATSIVFSTHLEGVVEESGSGSLDSEYLADFFATGEHLGPRTPFGHIRQLMPAESVTWRQGVLTSHRCWTLGSSPAAAEPDDRDYAEGLRSAVTDAVARALPERGPIWCELSGGLDSSTVFATAAQAKRVDLGAFSFLYSRSPDADERKWIQLVLDRHPAPWHTVDADDTRPFSEFPDPNRSEPSLALLEAGWNRRYVSALRAHAVTAVLTGLGGDEIFGTHSPKPFHFADLLLQGRHQELVDAARTWSSQKEARGSPEAWVTRFAIEPIAAHRSGQVPGYRPVDIPWVSAEYAQSSNLEERGRQSWAPSVSSVGESWFLANVLQAAHAASHTLVERTVGAEFRHPLLHRPLVAYVASIPWEAKLKPDCPRSLQRSAFGDRLPAELLRRRDKPGLNTVFTSGLAESPEWRRRLTEHSCLADLGMVDAERWRQAVDQAACGSVPGGIRAFLASACLEIWLQQVDSSSGQANPARPRAE